MNNSIIAAFREKLAAGDCVYGPFMKTGDPMFVEATGLAGFDFAILDMEHGPTLLQEQQNNIRAAELRGLFPIVRVKDVDENTIGSVMDIGACGVQVPQVKTAQQAKEVVTYAKFYPYGMRGVCRFVRAADYSHAERSHYFESSKDLVVIIQLEGMEAIQNLDTILDVEGVDILFIGPYDLSQSLGCPGDVANPLVVEKMQFIIEKAKAKGKVIGTFVDDVKMLKFWREVGVQYLSYNVDIGIYMDACKRVLDQIKA